MIAGVEPSDPDVAPDASAATAAAPMTTMVVASAVAAVPGPSAGGASDTENAEEAADAPVPVDVAIEGVGGVAATVGGDDETSSTESSPRVSGGAATPWGGGGVGTGEIGATWALCGAAATVRLVGVGSGGAAAHAEADVETAVTVVAVTEAAAPENGVKEVAPDGMGMGDDCTGGTPPDGVIVVVDATGAAEPAGGGATAVVEVPATNESRRGSASEAAGAWRGRRVKRSWSAVGKYSVESGNEP